MSATDWPLPLELLDDTAELNGCLEALGRRSWTIATAPFDREIIVVEAGGRRTPPILITAGAHATEIEGILAAIHLAESVETAHRVVIVPIRDPLGMEGFASTLRLASGDSRPLDSFAQARQRLREGDIVHDDGDLLIAEFGPVSFAIRHRGPDWTPWGHHVIYDHMRRLVASDPDLGERLRGRRMLIPAASPELEGLGDFDRAWTAVGSGDDILHLNRFFDAPDAPDDIAGLRGLIDDLEPGLVIDLHAGTSDRFWLPYPLPQRDDQLSRWVAEAMAGAVSGAGYQTASLEELRNEGGISRTFFDSYVDYGNGVTPFYTDERGEGLNFMDYCRRYGVSVGTEAGQRAPLAAREDMIYRAASAGIRAWETRHEHG